MGFLKGKARKMVSQAVEFSFVTSQEKRREERAVELHCSCSTTSVTNERAKNETDGDLRE
jgi:hypothetical protein